MSRDCTHSHSWAPDTTVAERSTRLVVALTAAMMVIEIAAGLAFGSMALLADGWHMSTHVTAFLITAVAYWLSRRHAADRRYSFGTGKMGVLGGFASAIVLAIVALLMAGESVSRLFDPPAIRFHEAIAVSVVGLAVNVACALLLRSPHSHPGGHDHSHSHDLNLRAAYVHVIADALTSVTAIVALVCGLYLGWGWLDPAMGIFGSIVISVWAYTLLRDTGGILLDRTPDSSDLPAEIRSAIEQDGDAVITDLHVWQVAAGRFAAIVTVAGKSPKDPDAYRRLLSVHEELVHLTLEVRRQAPPYGR